MKYGKFGDSVFSLSFFNKQSSVFKTRHKFRPGPIGPHRPWTSLRPGGMVRRAVLCDLERGKAILLMEETLSNSSSGKCSLRDSIVPYPHDTGPKATFSLRAASKSVT